MGKLDQLKQGAAASLAGYQEPQGAAAPSGQTATAAPQPEPAESKPERAKAKAWTRGEGKSRNPEYGRFTVYVPDKLRTTAERKWADSTGKDASDLVEHLLSQYITT